MVREETIKFFEALLKERHNKLCESAENLFRALPTENADNKKQCAERARDNSHALIAVLPEFRVPRWLITIKTCTQRYISGELDVVSLLLNFVPAKQEMEKHVWFFDADGETAFDFDEIYERYKKESRLPELFNDIVRILEEIEKSGEVDSVTMIRALGKVIATIKRCKDGSYFSINSTWEFLSSFLKNYLWGELAKLPLLGTAVEALRKTLEETNEEMFKLYLKVDEEMRKTVEAEVTALTDRTSFKFMVYDKTGYTLPSQIKLLPNTSA